MSITTAKVTQAVPPTHFTSAVLVGDTKFIPVPHKQYCNEQSPHGSGESFLGINTQEGPMGVIMHMLHFLSRTKNLLSVLSRKNEPVIPSVEQCIRFPCILTNIWHYPTSYFCQAS